MPGYFGSPSTHSSGAAAAGGGVLRRRIRTTAAAITTTATRAMTSTAKSVVGSPRTEFDDFAVTLRYAWALVFTPRESWTETVTMKFPVTVGVHERSATLDVAQPVGSPV